VIEIDAASNTASTNISAELDRAFPFSPPGPGPLEGYVIASATMLSTAAFNALSTTGGAPPRAVVFGAGPHGSGKPFPADDPPSVASASYIFAASRLAAWRATCATRRARSKIGHHPGGPAGWWRNGAQGRLRDAESCSTQLSLLPAPNSKSGRILGALGAVAGAGTAQPGHGLAGLLSPGVIEAAACGWTAAANFRGAPGAGPPCCAIWCGRSAPDRPELSSLSPDRAPAA